MHWERDSIYVFQKTLYDYGTIYYEVIQLQLIENFHMNKVLTQSPYFGKHSRFLGKFLGFPKSRKKFISLSQCLRKFGEANHKCYKILDKMGKTLDFPENSGIFRNMGKFRVFLCQVPEIPMAFSQNLFQSG